MVADRQSRGLGVVRGVAVAAGAFVALTGGLQAFATAPAARMPAAPSTAVAAKASRHSLAGLRTGTHGAKQAKAGRHVSQALIARQAKQVDLSGKVAFIAGVADASGYGWAIAKELANAGATIVIGTWPPVLKMFEITLKKSATDEARKLDDGSLMEIAKIYPLDATFDTPEDVPDDVKANKRYAGAGDFTISDVVKQVEKDFGKVDILVHSLANGPEVTKPLLETSRAGYLAASSASAYSMVSLVQKFAPIMPPGGSVVSLTYFASVRVIPGYGGGMSSAKAQLESDTRTLAWEAGRKYGVRVNTISAGPLKSRAASAIGKDGDKTFIERAIDYSTVNAPLAKDLYAEHIGTAALSLLSPLMTGVTGTTLYVDNGLNIMGQSIDSPAYEGLPPPPATPEF